MVSGIDSLISLCDFSLLIYINAITFCLLVLYPATLLNLFVSSNSFSGIFHFSTHSKSRHLQIKTVLLIPLRFGDFCFSCLTALARNFRTTLNKSNDSGHPCLILDVRGDASRLSSLSRLVTYGFNYVEICSLYGLPWDCKSHT